MRDERDVLVMVRQFLQFKASRRSGRRPPTGPCAVAGEIVRCEFYYDTEAAAHQPVRFEFFMENLMLKILGRKSSSNVQKVLWCCAEIGLAFERADIGGDFGGNKTPDYLALNPNGLVPTINDDGFILWESNSCVRYLAAKYGKGKLWPADPQVAASASRWMDWQLSTVNAPVGTLFRSMLKKPADDIPADELDAAAKSNT